MGVVKPAWLPLLSCLLFSVEARIEFLARNRCLILLGCGNHQLTDPRIEYGSKRQPNWLIRLSFSHIGGFIIAISALATEALSGTHLSHVDGWGSLRKLAKTPNVSALFDGGPCLDLQGS